MGPSGAGKGTQANLIIDLLKQKDNSREVIHIETGKKFRELAETSSHTGKLINETIVNGNLIPEFLCVYAWGSIMADKFTGNEHLIFDGTPRKLKEAELLTGLFPFYKLGKPWVIYLDVHPEESIKRLRARNRNDDTHDAILRRLEWYKGEVLPSVEYYRNHPDVNFLDINGIGKIEVIHADIVKKVGLE